MRRLLFDVNTQVDLCFSLSETPSHTLSLWEDAVYKAVKSKSLILGTMGFTLPSEGKKYLIRGTNGWMKLHETGVRKPLLLSNESIQSMNDPYFLNLLKEVDAAQAVYYEYRYHTGLQLPALYQLLIAKATTQEAAGWYEGLEEKLTITEETELCLFGNSKDLPGFIEVIKGWAFSSFKNPGNLLITQVP